MTDQSSLQRMLAHHEIGRLLDAYGDIANRRAFGEMGQIFGPGSVMHLEVAGRDPFDVVGADAIAQFHESAIERFEFYIYTSLGVRIEVADDPDPLRATGRVWMCEVRRDVGTLDWSTAYGVFQDTYARLNGRWIFDRREYHTLTRSGAGVSELPPFHQLGDISDQ